MTNSGVNERNAVFWIFEDFQEISQVVRFKLIKQRRVLWERVLKDK